MDVFFGGKKIKSTKFCNNLYEMTNGTVVSDVQDSLNIKFQADSFFFKYHFFKSFQKQFYIDPTQNVD